MLDKYSKNISISIGAAYLQGAKYKPIITSRFLNNYGPAFTARMDLTKRDRNSWTTQLRYAFFGSTFEDTVLISPINAYPDSFEKHYDLEGRADLISLGSSWKHYLGQNVKIAPYTILGGEILYKFRNFETSAYTSSEFEGQRGYIQGTYHVLSLNIHGGIGLRHNITENFSLFEQLDLSYMIFEKSTSGKAFSPKDFNQEFLFNLSFGCSLNFSALFRKN